MGYVTCWDPTSCPNILKGPQREKTPSQNLLSAWPAGQVSPKRLSEGFPLQFAFSRHQPLTLPNFLTLHHKSKCWFLKHDLRRNRPKSGLQSSAWEVEKFQDWAALPSSSSVHWLHLQSFCHKWAHLLQTQPPLTTLCNPTYFLRGSELGNSRSNEV